MSLRASCLALLVLLAIAPLRAGGEDPVAAVEGPPEAEESSPAPEIPEEPAPETSPEMGKTLVPNPDAPAPLLHGTLEVSLQDAIRMGLENNLDVQIERYSPILAQLDTQAAWGAYDPTLFAEIDYIDNKTPNSFAITGVDKNVDRSTDGFGGVRGILPITSTIFSTQFDGGRSTTNSNAETLSPRYDSGWSIDVTQPVLRNLYWNQPWTQVQSTRLLLDSTQEEFRRAVMDTVQRIEDAYWTLIATEEALRVANKSLETASALLNQTKTQFEVGVVSKVEVTEAEAGVSQREVERIRAENTYRNQQDVLIDLVLGPNLRAASTLELRPTDRPDDFTPYDVDVEGAVSRAFEYRPELAQASKDIERSEVEAKFARNQMLPQLDGVFRFGQSGLSGDQSGARACRFAVDPVACLANPPANRFPGDFNDSVDDYEDYPQYVVGGRLSIPFPNQTARAISSQRDVELTRSRTNMRRLEQQIIIDVRQAARNLEASQEGITAARSARVAAAEQLRAEEIRLEYGESTPFDVLQREEQLVEREREEIGAFQAYRTSATALDRAQGTILRNRNIDIAEAARLR